MASTVHPPFQVTFDAHSPAELAAFWAVALGYILQPPPPGYETWEQFADAVGIPEDARDNLAAIVDPEGPGPRVLFQKVPEAKSVKNRVHLDINVGGEGPDGEAAISSRVALLESHGAAVVEHFDEPIGRWVVMTDPEGNEFCVQ